MSNRPTVSVIMNCYNGARYLRQAVESVLAQTYDDWEIIFWDNQSTDESAEIFKSYDDPRLTYIYAPTHTVLYEARNYVIEHARGALLAFLDVDDWWLPEKLALQVCLFDDQEVGIACANYTVKHESKGGREWTALASPPATGHVLDELLRDYRVGLLTLMVRKAALDDFPQPFDPRYHIIGDFDLVIRLATGWKLGYVDTPVAVYRLHASNETGRHRLRHVDELRLWQQDMQADPLVSSKPGFLQVALRTDYIEAMHYLLQGDKLSAFFVIRRMPLNPMSLRLWLGLFAPTSLVRRLKN